MSNRKSNSRRSAMNYDLLAATYQTLRSLSPNLTFADFVGTTIPTENGSSAALWHLHATDSSSGTTSLATASPFLTVIRLPGTLPELSTVPSESWTGLAISFRLGLLAAVHYTGPGSSTPVKVQFVPLTRSSSTKVRRTLLQSIKRERRRQRNMEARSRQARSGFSTGSESAGLSSSTTTIELDFEQLRRELDSPRNSRSKE